MENLTIEKIVLPEGYNGQEINITLREGSASDPVRTVQPRKREIKGDIQSVYLYSKDRFLLPEIVTKALVEYSDDPNQPWIFLDTDIDHPLSTTVKGELVQNPDIKNFSFNRGAVFTNKTFIQVIKENAHCMENLAQARALIKQLQSFVARFTTDVEDIDDKQGNTKYKIETKLEAAKTGIPEAIIFDMPFFIGSAKTKFSVEVEIEVVMTNSKPEAKFGFFSLEFNQLLRDEAQKAVAAEIQKLSNNFTCIRVN